MNTRSAFICAVMAFGLGLLGMPGMGHTDIDVGNIAVIETDPTILQPGELFDLNNQTLTFTPNPGGGYMVGVGPLSVDSSLGTNLGLGGDASVAQPLNFTFPFFGVNQASVFINANGNLTFGAASALTHFNAGGSVTSLGTNLFAILDRFSSLSPRIAPLWQDWDPTTGGGVFANSLGNRLIVTWSAVPLFNTATTATFQVVIFDTGVIQMHYQNVPTTPAGGYLTGVSPGSQDQFVTTAIDFSAGADSSVSAFPNFEALVQVFGSTTSPLVHIPAVARRFYKTHPDQYSQIAMWANFIHAMGSAFAFELPLRQTVSGIGQSLYDISSFYGGLNSLTSFLNMNRLNVYPSDPNSTFLGTNTTLDLMGQESGHQWLAFPRFDNGGVCSDLLLGRGLAHWNFFLDSDASDVEGNKWQDNGAGTFTTIESTARYSSLDQYIMGLRMPSEVLPFFFIKNPTNTGGHSKSSAPQVGVTVNGTRQDVTLDQIITCEGARTPSSGFTEVNPTTTWKLAFILLIRGGTIAPAADTTKINTIREAWVPYFNSATGGRGTVDTIINANIPDLVVSALSDPPSAAAPGTTFLVTDTVLNQGSATAGASTTRYRLSLDTTITSADVLLTGTRAVPGLPAGANSTGTVTVTIPSTIAAGTYFLGACADYSEVVGETSEANNCRASATTVVVGTVDLVVSAVSDPPATALMGSSFTVTDTVVNQGAGAAGASTTRYRLSLDATITSADVLLTGTRAVPGLAAGANSTGTVTVTIPTGTAVGTYFLGACADNTSVVVESNETNNCRTSATTVQVTKPDLVVSAVSDPPATAVVGGSFAVTDTVLNQGSATAGASTTRYRLSVDATITSTDVLLTGTRSVPSLDGGLSSSGTVTVTVPTTVAAGTYFLGACADYSAVVAESSEANNCRASTATVVVGTVDLVVSAVSDPPATAVVGSSFTITDTVVNQGTGAAGASTTRYRLSLDATITSSDPLLTGTRAVPGLAAGANSTGTVTVTIPTGTAVGTYFLGACADNTLVVVESNETNNCRTSATTVQVTKPDLVVSAVSDPPATTIVGGSFAVTDTVLNQGSATAGASTTRYRLSLDATITSSDLLLTGTRAVPGLPAGANSTGTGTVTIPITVAAGTYFLGACADYSAVVAESSEANNCRASVGTVQIGLPDLVTTALTDPPATASVGSSFAVTDTVLNQGPGSAAASITRYYLSPDSTITATDVLLTGNRAVPSLAGSASSTDTVTVMIPAGMAAGTYFLGACADDLGAVAESNETNNCRASVGTVAVTQPDVTQPTGSITINRNANVTLTTAVALNLTAGDAVGVLGYYVSMSSSTPSPGAAGWVAVTSTQSYSATIPFTLTSGEATKTVYAWYKDAAGNVSATASDSIILQTPPAGTPLPSIAIQQIAGGLAYPVAITHAGDGSGRLFIALQEGKIMIHDGTQIVPTAFLDLTSLVSCCGEQGLLGVAFHPNYAGNGFFYVNYTNTAGNTVIARYTVSANPSIADPGSAVIVLPISQPYSNHNGGQLQFGPDGYLYIGMGDGGSAGDPENRAQNLAEFLGKILRIDVNAGSPYAVPSNNPFVGTSGARPEIWTLGLRNPWRFSFDRLTGDLFIGDVGQSAREEVDLQPSTSPGGENYGWRRMEGNACFNPSSGCNDGTLILPILEYTHGNGDCTVIGGYRYRGTQVAGLGGAYIYGDYCTGRIWGATVNGQLWGTTQLLDLPFLISTFGEDQGGELYVAEYAATGAIYRMSNASPPTASAQSVSTNEDTAKLVTLAASDPDSASVTFAIGTGPTHGVLSAIMGTSCTPAGGGSTCTAGVTYTPAANFNGADSFTFTATDGTTTSPEATVAVTITPVNDAPTAMAQSVSVPANTETAITLAGTDMETLPGNLSATIETPPVHGTLTGTGLTRTYTPMADYTGPDSFIFTVTDRGDPDACGAPGPSCAAPLMSAAATVSITVQANVPDLVVSAVSDPPATANVGSSFAVTDTVFNQGPGSAAASTTRYYLSPDSTITATGVLLMGNRAVPSLAGSASSTDTVTVMIPAGTAAGTYFLGACTDDLGAVAESNETNNCRASITTIQVTP